LANGLRLNNRSLPEFAEPIVETGVVLGLTIVLYMAIKELNLDAPVTILVRRTGGRRWWNFADASDVVLKLNEVKER
jgi:hypothetical protein